MGHASPVAIDNAKRLLLNVDHQMKPEYLQNYLNEFCSKFNRRYLGEKIFDRVLIATVDSKNTLRRKILQS
jgi:arginyl-tRNA synthetase